MPPIPFSVERQLTPVDFEGGPASPNVNPWKKPK